MADEAHPAYVGYCKTCGGINACCVDDAAHRKETAKFCAEIVRRGDRLERKTVGYVRTEAFGLWCTCHKKEEKPVKQEALAL